MDPIAAIDTPARHTSDGGVVVGATNARRQLVLFEDPQCPYCRRFEEVSGDIVAREVAAGAVAVEYRMRCFLGPESVRADNALALAAEVGHFDQLHRELFANQPPEHTGGFTVADLLSLGRAAGLTGPDYESGVRTGRYEKWVIAIDKVFEKQDRRGTPAGILDGHLIQTEVLYEPEALGALIRG
jgi:Thioredoxin